MLIKKEAKRNQRREGRIHERDEHRVSKRPTFQQF